MNLFIGPVMIANFNKKETQLIIYIKVETQNLVPNFQ